MTAAKKRDMVVRLLQEVVDCEIIVIKNREDAIRKAIAMLKAQELCDGDAISRSALLAAYDAARKGTPGGTRKLIEDAPAVVLKVQDPMEPKKLLAASKIGYRYRFFCGKCGGEIERLDCYCKHCGKAAKWG